MHFLVPGTLSRTRWTALAVGAVLALPSFAMAADAPKAGASAPASPTGTKYKADADMQGVLDTLAGLGGKPIETLDAAEARRQPTPTDAVTAILKKQGKDTTPTALVPGVKSVDQTIPGPAAQLPVRIYTPDGAGPFPIVVYFHGGGWVIADKNVYDGGARGIAKEANAVVVSVDYRLAPEAKFPAQHDDALATYKWAAANAAVLNGDPKRLALAGESAGGNLAIATAMAARDQNLPAPLHVLSVYPIAQATNLSTPSYQDSEKAKPLNKAMMGWFADKVFAKAADRKDPRIDLIDANLKGLPPVTLINARIDPLRSDADLLAAALKKAGVKTEHKVYDGVTHEFFGMAAVVAKAKQAQAFAGQQLKKAFAGAAGA
ncbi:MAG: alpha/beta hydrolase fold domain-containing protein [Caldimonas sp.]